MPTNTRNQIRLHIGCADIKIEGFINIDARKTTATDLVANAWDLRSFQDNTVSFIYTRHMIEHLEPDDAISAVAEWFRVLEVGGIIQVICPDIEFHCRQFLGMEQSTITNDQRAHAMAGFFGWRIPSRGGNLHDNHRWGYSVDSLAEILVKAGFQSIYKVLKGKDTEPWHINLKAVK